VYRTIERLSNEKDGFTGFLRQGNRVFAPVFALCPPSFLTLACSCLDPAFRYSRRRRHDHVPNSYNSYFGRVLNIERLTDFARQGTKIDEGDTLRQTDKAACPPGAANIEAAARRIIQNLFAFGTVCGKEGFTGELALDIGDTMQQALGDITGCLIGFGGL
jgi:hypothetical protein